MAIFNTLPLNCFLLPLFNPPVRYLGLPHPPTLSLPSSPPSRDRQVHTVHTRSRPQVATCKLDPGLSTCQFHRVLVLLC